METPNFEANALAAAQNDPAMIERARLMATRYLYSPFCDAIVDNFPAGYIPKGQIVAVGIQFQDDWVEDKPVQREVSPLEIVNSVRQRYGGKGLVEITALAGMPEAQFSALKLNERFGLTAELNVEQIRASVDTAKNKTTNLPPDSDVRQRIEKLAAEISHAVSVSEQYCRQFIDDKHGEMQQARNGDPNFNPNYDQGVLVAFRYLNRQPETPAWRKQDALPPVAPAPLVVDWESLGRGIAAGMGQTLTGLPDAIAAKVADVVKPESAKPRNNAPLKTAPAAA